MSSRAVRVECQVETYRRLTTEQFVLSEIEFPTSMRNVPQHHHTRHVVSLVRSGILAKSFGSREMMLDAPSLVTIPAGADHCDHFSGGGTRVVTVEIEPEKGHLPELLEPCAELITVVQERRNAQIERITGQLSRELREQDSLSPLACFGLVLDLLASTARGSASLTGKQPPAWLLRARDYLYDHRTRAIQIDEVAEAVDIHAAYLARMFRQHFGQPIGAYARQLRLETAAIDLQTTNQPISEIALKYGFSDQSHFTRLFRRRFRTTPARYRADYQR